MLRSVLGDGCCYCGRYAPELAVHFTAGELVAAVDASRHP
jgi:hypothetical protein